MTITAQHWTNVQDEIRTGYVIEKFATHVTCGERVIGAKSDVDERGVVFVCTACEAVHQEQFTLFVEDDIIAVVVEECENGVFN